jgi:hypothetical protein
LHNSKLLQPLLNLREQVQEKNILPGQLMEGDLYPYEPTGFTEFM